MINQPAVLLTHTRRAWESRWNNFAPGQTSGVSQIPDRITPTCQWLTADPEDCLSTPAKLRAPTDETQVAMAHITDRPPRSVDLIET